MRTRIRWLVVVAVVMMAGVSLVQLRQLRSSSDRAAETQHPQQARAELELAATAAAADNSRARADPAGVAAAPPVFMVVLVLSDPSPAARARRNGLRATWLRDVRKLQRRTLVQFVVGTLEQPAEIVAALEAEHAEHGDMALLAEHVESYHTLTAKLLRGFVHAHNQLPPFRFLLKVDEDTFVRLPELQAELDRVPAHTRLYMGYFDGRAPVKRHSSKWAESNWMLCDHYLPYALGGGYVLASELVGFVARNSDMLSLYNSEDVSLGAWLAGLNVTRVHDVRFDTEWKSRGCRNDYLVMHKQSTESMRERFARIESTNGLEQCVKEWSARPAYEYNWGVLPSQCCPGRGKN